MSHSKPPHSQQPSYSFPKANRVRLHKDLETVRRDGKSLRTNNFEVRVLKRESEKARVGIVVPKYGHSAVKRNLLKRRIRELVRIQLLPYIPSVDIFIRPLPCAYKKTFVELGRDIEKIVAKLQSDWLEQPGALA